MLADDMEAILHHTDVGVAEEHKSLETALEHPFLPAATFEAGLTGCYLRVGKLLATDLQERQHVIRSMFNRAKELGYKFVSICFSFLASDIKLFISL